MYDVRKNPTNNYNELIANKDHKHLFGPWWLLWCKMLLLNASKQNNRGKNLYFSLYKQGFEPTKNRLCFIFW